MPEKAPQEAQKPTPPSDNEIGTQAGKQGLQPNLWTDWQARTPTKLVESGVNGLDTLLKGLMDPNTLPKPNTPNNQILPIYVPKDLKPISKS